MKFKTLVIIFSTLMAVTPISSHGEDTETTTSRRGQIAPGATPVGELPPQLYQSIFVPLDKVDPTEVERAQYVKNGEEALARGELKEAQAFFNQALMLNIKDVKANLSLGKLLFQEKQYFQAQEYFLRVLKEDPNKVEALLTLGKINLARLKKIEAFEFFQEVAEIHPDNAEAASYIRSILDEAEVKDSLPTEYYAIGQSPALTRAELAALIYFKTDKLKAIKTPPQPQIITDLGESWADEYIRDVAKYKVMDVYPNHTFQPQTTVNRGEFAQVVMNLIQALGLYETYRATNPPTKLQYEDVGPFNNYYEAVRLVTDLDIISPGQDTEFNLSLGLSGEEAVEYFGRFDLVVRLLQANR